MLWYLQEFKPNIGENSVPLFERGEIKLYDEEHGTGFPVLLIAPGGMRSAVSFWQDTPGSNLSRKDHSWR
jgi:hypothetical protein